MFDSCESEVLQHKANDSPETAHIEEGIKIKPLTVGKCFLCVCLTRRSYFLY